MLQPLFFVPVPDWPKGGFTFLNSKRNKKHKATITDLPKEDIRGVTGSRRGSVLNLEYLKIVSTGKLLIIDKESMISCYRWKIMGKNEVF